VPAGPWSTAARLPATPLGSPDTFNTYFTSLLSGSRGTLTIGLTNNRWDGQRSVYCRPTFQTASLPMCGQSRATHGARDAGPTAVPARPVIAVGLSSAGAR
jgi:hypothetical protein